MNNSKLCVFCQHLFHFYFLFANPQKQLGSGSVHSNFFDFQWDFWVDDDILLCESIYEKSFHNKHHFEVAGGQNEIKITCRHCDFIPLLSFIISTARTNFFVLLQPSGRMTSGNFPFAKVVKVSQLIKQKCRKSETECHFSGGLKSWEDEEEWKCAVSVDNYKFSLRSPFIYCDDSWWVFHVTGCQK